MTKISKSDFILAENPLVDDGRVFVCHIRKLPVIIAEAFHFEGYTGDEPEVMECKARFEAGASVDYPDEPVVLGAIFISEFSEEDQKLSPQEQANKLSRIMSRMGDWYYAYLKWEDRNIMKGEE